MRLALGQATLDQAAKYLHDTVPMDVETARAEATAFATGPGGAISYQIGKLQIMKFLADARLQTRSLWLPIGLHAGWIFSRGAFNKIARS